MAFEITDSRLALSVPLPGTAALARAVAAVGFLGAVYLYALQAGSGLPATASQLWLLAAAAVVGGYMAMNIGANDAANNMGPIVGARGISLGWALLIAAIFEALGAVVAGAQVVSTVKSGIIDPAGIADPADFAWLMMSALMAGALWLHLATILGAPVSTTHSIVGALLGAGITAGGLHIVNWGTMGNIVASWVVSPLCGGAIAALILYAIKRRITWQHDMTAAAARTVPWLIAAMVWAFGSYMLVKGLGQIVKLKPGPALAWGALLAIGALVALRGPVARLAARQANDKAGVNRLFIAPLICAAALLSFAHGANDVANAVGPLAAIYQSVASGAVAAKAQTPMWVLLLGALGLSVGLALYGGKIIRTVGSGITELDAMRVYAITMAAAMTVIVASQLGLPISTTHVTVGAVFGVGFLREGLKRRHARRAGGSGRDCAPLVQRGAMWRIAAAWVITVPATALLAAALFTATQWLR
jgi:PiT family inorganic phosphate transporter